MRMKNRYNHKLFKINPIFRYDCVYYYKCDRYYTYTEIDKLNITSIYFINKKLSDKKHIYFICA